MGRKRTSLANISFPFEKVNVRAPLLGSILTRTKFRLDYTCEINGLPAEGSCMESSCTACTHLMLDLMRTWCIGPRPVDSSNEMELVKQASEAIPVGDALYLTDYYFTRISVAAGFVAVCLEAAGATVSSSSCPAGFLVHLPPETPAFVQHYAKCGLLVEY